MISSVGCMSYYNRDTGEEEIILEGTMISVVLFDNEKIKGRFINISDEEIVIDTSIKYNSIIRTFNKNLISKIITENNKDIEKNL